MSQPCTICIDSRKLRESVRRAGAILNYEFNLRPEGEEAALLGNFMGSYIALSEELRRAVNGAFPLRQKLAYIDLYALNIAARFATGDSAADGHFPYALSLKPEQAESEPAIRRKLLLHETFRLYQETMPKGGEGKETHTRLLLKSIAAESEESAQLLEYAQLRDHFGAFAVEIGGSTFHDLFKLDAVRRAAVRILSQTLEEVVGNDELKEALFAAMNSLAEYRKAGVKLSDLVDLPRTINAYGPPGTGKSSTIMYAVEWAQRELGPGMAVPLELRQISNRQKSKYFSESAGNIEAIFDEMEKGERAYALVIDDIDKVIFGAGTLESSTEERAILETLMRRLEGLSASDKANYVVITTSNEPLAIHRALGQRLSQLSVPVLGPASPQERAEILRLKLQKAFVNNYAVDLDMDALGALLHSHGMNGRDIRNVVRTAYDTFRREAAKGKRRFGGEELAGAIRDGHLLTEASIRRAIEHVHQQEREKRQLQLRAEVERRKESLQVELLARSSLEKEVTT